MPSGRGDKKLETRILRHLEFRSLPMLSWPTRRSVAFGRLLRGILPTVRHWYLGLQYQVRSGRVPKILRRRPPTSGSRTTTLPRGLLDIAFCPTRRRIPLRALSLARRARTRLLQFNRHPRIIPGTGQTFRKKRTRIVQKGTRHTWLRYLVQASSMGLGFQSI
jgi:hypothetical protein